MIVAEIDRIAEKVSTLIGFVAYLNERRVLAQSQRIQKNHCLEEYIVHGRFFLDKFGQVFFCDEKVTDSIVILKRHFEKAQEMFKIPSVTLKMLGHFPNEDTRCTICGRGWTSQNFTDFCIDTKFVDFAGKSLEDTACILENHEVNGNGKVKWVHSEMDGCYHAIVLMHKACFELSDAKKKIEQIRLLFERAGFNCILVSPFDNKDIFTVQTELGTFQFDYHRQITLFEGETFLGLFLNRLFEKRRLWIFGD